MCRENPNSYDTNAVSQYVAVVGMIMVPGTATLPFNVTKSRIKTDSGRKSERKPVHWWRQQ